MTLLGLAGLVAFLPTAGACHATLATSPATPPGQVPNYNHGDDFAYRVYLEAESANGGAFLSPNEKASATASYSHGDASGGALAGAAVMAGQAPTTIPFVAKEGLATDLYFNLSKPANGILYWTSATQEAARRETANVRVLVYAGDKLVGGDDCATNYGANANNAWNALTLRFRPEVAMLEKGTILTVKVLRFGNLADFKIGTDGASQSFVEFRVTSYDLLDSAISIQNHQIKFGVPDEPGSSGEAAPDDAPASSTAGGIVTSAAFMVPVGLFAFARSRRPTKALLAVLLLFPLAFAGCLGGQAKTETTDDPDAVKPTVEQQVEQREELRKEGIGAMEGLVRNDLGIPMGGVHVSILGTSWFADTDFKGRFKFPNVSAGDQRLRFDKEKYMPLEQTIRVDVGAHLVLNVTMVPKPGITANQREHFHDVWGTRSSVEIYSGGFTPISSAAGASGQASGAYYCQATYSNCLTQIPIDESNVVLAGTGRIEVVLSWDQNTLPAKEMYLVITTPKAVYRYANTYYYSENRFIARGPGVPFQVQIFPDEADPGHQAFTKWKFSVQFPNTGLYVPWAPVAAAGTTISAKITAFKGTVLPEPQHKDFWGNATRKDILIESKKSLLCSGTCSYPYNGQTYMWWYNDWKTLIPPGTKQIDGKLRWNHAQLGENPAQNDWTIAYSGGDSPYTTVCCQPPSDVVRVRELERKDAELTFVIDVDPADWDPFYILSSNWEFFPDDKVDNLAGTTYSANTGYQTTLWLSLTLVKDPEYRDA